MRMYKCVWKTAKGKLVSIIANGKAKVEYKVGEWVKAPEWLREKGYHLFVFEKKEDAINFISGGLGDVWLVEVENITKDLPIGMDTYFLRKGKLVADSWGFPEGTVMAEKVKLLKKVYSKEN